MVGCSNLQNRIATPIYRSYGKIYMKKIWQHVSISYEIIALKLVTFDIWKMILYSKSTYSKMLRFYENAFFTPCNSSKIATLLQKTVTLHQKFDEIGSCTALSK